MNIHLPVVAGLFYPADPQELMRNITQLLQHAQSSQNLPKAIIAPHAGYIYSGPIAANAYSVLTHLRNQIKTVVLLGPAHFYPFQGLAIHSADYFVTPLGKIAIDTDKLQSLLELPQVQLMPDAFTREHSLEVHLPFLQTLLDNFNLLPILVGDANPQIVSEVLNKVWGGMETLIIISSDLSHYLDYHSAQLLDRQTTHAIEQLQPQAIHYDQACGCDPINGLLTIAQQKNLTVKTLDVRNSGDTAGTKDRVVGYGAYHFFS